MRIFYEYVINWKHMDKTDYSREFLLLYLYISDTKNCLKFCTVFGIFDTFEEKQRFDFSS